MRFVAVSRGPRRDSQFLTVPDVYPNSVTMSTKKNQIGYPLLLAYARLLP